MTHGIAAYVRHGCRCNTCKQANAQYDRAREQDRLSQRIDRQLLADALQELFPLGLTDDCPARKMPRIQGGDCP